MEDQSKSGDEFSGWKAIAKFLGVSPRTAQDYERLGLPVHRLEGLDKPRVWAYASELTAWKNRPGTVGESADTETADPQPLPVGSQVAGAQHIDLPTRRHWLRRYGWLGAAPVAVGIAGAVAAPHLWRQLHQPASSHSIEGATLIVFGKDNVELWRHTFPQQIVPDPEPTEQRRKFADLDGDGKTETLFIYSPPATRKADLCCFESNGKLRWQFVPGRKEVFDYLGRSLAPPYEVNAFGVVPPSSLRSSKVVATSTHQWSFADQVGVLDGKTGKLLSEYWHRGHLNYMAVVDLDGDGEPEILLGGVNDAPEYKQATVLVFDHRRISGACRDPQGRPYFPGMEPGTEKLIVRFPKTPFSQEEEFNRVADIRVGPERITVVVVEARNLALGLSIIYEFDRHFQPLTAQLDGTLQQRYKELQDAGKLPKESPYTIADRLLSQVKVIRPGR